MTPSELNKIKAAVAEAAADLLAREGNESLTAETLAEELAESMIDSMVDTYEAIQAKSYNLVIVSSFKLPDGTVHTAAVGPLSTRAKQRARDVGERFAWDYKTRTGQGKYTLVPLIRNPNEAWDEARMNSLVEYEHHLSSVVPGSGEPTYEPMKLGLPDEVRSRITADWQADPDVLTRKYGPHCLCGRYTFVSTTNQGDPVTKGCPRHPERGSDGSEGPA